MNTALASLIDLARTTSDLAAWRRQALTVLADAVAFDRALFHELSPRVPLDRGALLGFTRRALEAGLGKWDSNAVEFARIRELALAQGGAASDTEAFSPGSRSSKVWRERVGKPLGFRATLFGHLVVHERIVAALLLGRSRGPAFTSKERMAFVSFLPVLAICDAFLQGLSHKQLSGVATHVECVDQRLTTRQREVVCLVALGHTNSSIGRALGISEHTVRNILVKVRERLSVANRAEIVRVAVMR